MPEDPRSSATARSPEASPATLRGYYEGRTPLKRLFSPVDERPADGHDRADRQGLLVDLGEFDPDLRKTVKLAFARVNPPRWLQAWLKAVVEREMEGVLNPEEMNTRLGLRRLFARFREGVSGKQATAVPRLRGPATGGVARSRGRAFNLLRLTLVWVHSVRELDPVDLAEEATRAAMLDGGIKSGGRDLDRKAVSPLLRATSPSALKTVLSSLQFWMEWARTARAEARAARERTDRLTDTISELRQHLSVAREEVRVIERQAADSERRVASLSRDLETERNRRINDLRAAKGRLQRLFDAELAPRLRGAREALDGGPLVVNVALERLDRSLELLEEERPWLSSD